MLFEKLKFLEDNVVASTHLVHNSMNELQKAFDAADITLNNSINAYNQLSFNKFVENVVEGQDSDMSFGGNLNASARTVPTETPMDQTTVIGDLRGEDEKLTQALQLALNEVNMAKEDKKDAKAALDEQDVDGFVLEGSTTPVAIDQSKLKQRTLKRDYLGTSKLIKLPYIIGKDEYKKHPFAGLVYRGDDELEQLDLYEEEMQQLLNDK